MPDSARARRERIHAVHIFVPGSRIVTEGIVGYDKESESQIYRVQYWEVQNDGSLKLMNPPPQDVAAYLLGRQQ